MKRIFRSFALAGFSLLAVSIQGQTRADADLLNEISKIKAIDNHAHPLKYVAPGAQG